MAGFFDTLFGGGAEKEAADKNKALLRSVRHARKRLSRYWPSWL
jgi:hypothetical protein